MLPGLHTRDPLLSPPSTLVEIFRRMGLGVPRIFFHPKSYFVFVRNPTLTPSGRKVTQAEEEEEKKKTPLIVDT